MLENQARQQRPTEKFTASETGLLVYADLDDNVYETGIEVADITMKSLLLEPHSVRPTWNYTIRHHQ
jgi:hypothetical protein